MRMGRIASTSLPPPGWPALASKPGLFNSPGVNCRHRTNRFLPGAPPDREECSEWSNCLRHRSFVAHAYMSSTSVSVGLRPSLMATSHRGVPGGAHEGTRGLGRRVDVGTTRRRPRASGADTCPAVAPRSRHSLQAPDAGGRRRVHPDRERLASLTGTHLVTRRSLMGGRGTRTRHNPAEVAAAAGPVSPRTGAARDGALSLQMQDSTGKGEKRFRRGLHGLFSKRFWPKRPRNQEPILPAPCLRTSGPPLPRPCRGPERSPSGTRGSPSPHRC